MTLRSSLIKCLLSAASLGLIAVGAWYGRTVPFAEQWPMFEALRTTASIIFAVVGAWLAIIYPDRLKLSFRLASAPSDPTSTGIGQLFTPVVHSTTILCVILVLGVIAPLAKRIDFPWCEIPIDCIRGGTYALLVTLTLCQLWTVVLTLVPADRVKQFTDQEDRHAATVAGYRGDSVRPGKGRP